MFKGNRCCIILTFQISLLSLFLTTPAAIGFELGPEEFVEADSTVIKVSGYSVPSFTHWDGDELMDLIIGEGGDRATDGKVRVYLNLGTATDPRFGDYFYAQSEGTDLICPGSG
jgi:hypothetical protein